MQLLWLRWECRSVIIQQQSYIQRIQHSSGEDRKCRVPDVRILQLNVIIQRRCSRSSRRPFMLRCVVTCTFS